MKAVTAGACLLLGAFVLARAALVSLTYDEAASYLRYISQDVLSIFNFEVATNHFLNTLLTKLAFVVAGDREIVLRTGGLIGYGLYLTFSVLILRNLEHRAIAAAGFVLLNLNPYLLDYFGLSRGYGLSLGLLMGAVYYLLRFIKHRLAIDGGTRDLTRALAFGCGSVLAGFSLLDAYLGVVAVAFVFIATLNRLRGTSSAPPDIDPAKGPRFRIRPWLPVAATIFTFLVLSQDARLSEKLYEPVTINVVGLSDAEVAAVKVWRIDLRRRPVGIARQPSQQVWRIDPPAPARGLRIEVPIGVAEKILDDRALIETVIGSHPFVHRRGTEGIWTLRDAGATAVFDSGPALSLARSKMPLYEPVINWGGDRGHLATTARYTAIVLGLLAGLAVLLGALGWGFRRIHLVTTPEWRALSASVLWLAAFAGTPLYILRRGEELYLGGTRGFVADTLYSLIENSFYGTTYFASQVDVVFAAIVAVVVAFVVVVLVRDRRGGIDTAIPAMCVFGILVVVSAAVVIQHRLFETPFLLSRTALCYIPLFVLFAAFVGDAAARIGAVANVLASAVAVAAALLMAAHFAVTANLSYTWDWKKDADTKVMVQELEKVITRERGPGSRVVLGVEPNYSAAAAFYSEKVTSVTIEMDTIPSPRGIDYFYVDERHADGLTVIVRYPVSSSVLARPGAR